MSQIMTPAHLRWEEFFERLEGPEGCNFREEIPGDVNSIRWTCSSDRDRPLARAILEAMGDIDIEASMEFFEEYGGYCDCEIVFNVSDA